MTWTIIKAIMVAVLVSSALVFWTMKQYKWGYFLDHELDD